MIGISVMKAATEVAAKVRAKKAVNFAEKPTNYLADGFFLCWGSLDAAAFSGGCD